MDSDYNAEKETRSMSLHRGHRNLKAVWDRVHQSEFHNRLYYKYFTYLMQDTLLKSHFCEHEIQIRFLKLYL